MLILMVCWGYVYRIYSNKKNFVNCDLLSFKWGVFYDLWFVWYFFKFLLGDKIEYIVRLML